MPAGSATARAIAEQAGVSRATVERVQRLEREAPEKFEAVARREAKANKAPTDHGVRDEQKPVRCDVRRSDRRATRPRRRLKTHSQGSHKVSSGAPQVVGKSESLTVSASDLSCSDSANL
jgi:hypothetical protein